MSRKEIHERAIRGYQEYQKWKEIAEFLEKAETPEALRVILTLKLDRIGVTPNIVFNSDRRAKVALDLLLKDRYPSFMVMERLRGRRKDEE